MDLDGLLAAVEEAASSPSAPIGEGVWPKEPAHWLSC